MSNELTKVVLGAGGDVGLIEGGVRIAHLSALKYNTKNGILDMTGNGDFRLSSAAEKAIGELKSMGWEITR